MAWIRTSEKLPKIGKFVLVCIRKNVILKGRLQINGWALMFLDGEGLFNGTIEYWRKLPKPPK